MFAFTRYTLGMVANRFNASIPALLRLTKEMQIPIWAELENVESSLYGSWAPEWTFHKSVELQLSDSTLRKIARAQNNTIKEPFICGSMAAGEELLNVRPCCRNNNNEVASFLLQCLAKITLTPVDLLIHACDFPKITQALITEGFQDKHTITTPESTVAPAPENDEVCLTDRELAEQLEPDSQHRPSPDSLNRWRRHPNDPLPHKVKRRKKYYEITEVMEWYKRYKEKMKTVKIENLLCNKLK